MNNKISEKSGDSPWSTENNCLNPRRRRHDLHGAPTTTTRTPEQRNTQAQCTICIPNALSPTASGSRGLPQTTSRLTHANTTTRARPWESSGHRSSLVRLAWSNAAPSRPTHCLRGTPSARTRTTLTIEVSMTTERHGKVGPNDGCPPLALVGGPDPVPGCFRRLDCFSAESGNTTLQWEPTATQDPCANTNSP